MIERVVRARIAGAAARYPTADGLTIPVTAADPAVAQRYATLVGTLPHGAELAELQIVVVAGRRHRRRVRRRARTTASSPATAGATRR